VIAWIELRRGGANLYGNLYHRPGRRRPRTRAEEAFDPAHENEKPACTRLKAQRRKRITPVLEHYWYFADVFSLNWTLCATSSEIHRCLMDELLSLPTTTSILRDAVIDIHAFERLSMCIDWRGLLSGHRTGGMASSGAAAES
jgi:hypothetical protein